MLSVVELSRGLMGSGRNRDERRGIHRPGPRERGRIAEELEGLARRRERDVLRQRRCREKKTNLAAIQQPSSVRSRRA